MSATKVRRYRVVWPCVLVKTGALAAAGMPGRGGYTVVTMYRDALLPEDAPDADVQRLLDRGAIEEV